MRACARVWRVWVVVVDVQIKDAEQEEARRAATEAEERERALAAEEERIQAEQQRARMEQCDKEVDEIKVRGRKGRRRGQVAVTSGREGELQGGRSGLGLRRVRGMTVGAARVLCAWVQARQGTANLVQQDNLQSLVQAQPNEGDLAAVGLTFRNDDDDVNFDEE